ncbi:cupin domain-containing protein [Periweissella fabaria]|uniref:Cupin type-2 domain-containing protein n=1 Tax=Periweissella fabaria TaxID=546157 RepID=A0ABM8Z7R0_9LACO|nr:cupin domain-containing protein [Periweissella fabaria]MCM0597870.1 cupin domain-containing protein [Periweissella fabaria]CAH0417319.1 hypothetical protein WFA24289_01651 [Periweissella fabaria]
MFFYDNEQTLQRVDDNSLRKVLAYGDGLMNTLVVFEHGLAVGSPIPYHQHKHVQTTFVLQGSFEFTIQYPDHIERHQVQVGDSIYFPSNYPHGCIPLVDDSRLLDSFTPIRKDFL